MRFDLDQQTNIGRGPTNTIQISDNFISSEHTRLTFRNGVWYVQDAGSVNGTYVNNQPAREPLPARAGDIVRVGYIQFKLTQ
jgi:pSer/pThr/pTyr-binding forkhead associated (FHA) protein